MNVRCLKFKANYAFTTTFLSLLMVLAFLVVSGNVKAFELSRDDGEWTPGIDLRLVTGISPNGNNSNLIMLNYYNKDFDGLKVGDNITKVKVGLPEAHNSPGDAPLPRLYPERDTIWAYVINDRSGSGDVKLSDASDVICAKKFGPGEWAYTYVNPDGTTSPVDGEFVTLEFDSDCFVRDNGTSNPGIFVGYGANGTVPRPEDLQAFRDEYQSQTGDFESIVSGKVGIQDAIMSIKDELASLQVSLDFPKSSNRFLSRPYVSMVVILNDITGACSVLSEQEQIDAGLEVLDECPIPSAGGALSWRIGDYNPQHFKAGFNSLANLFSRNKDLVVPQIDLSAPDFAALKADIDAIVMANGGVSPLTDLERYLVKEGYGAFIFPPEMSVSAAFGSTSVPLGNGSTPRDDDRVFSIPYIRAVGN